MPLPFDKRSRGALIRLVQLWRQPRIRSFIFQALTLTLVAYLCWHMIENTAANLARQNIASGFGFLNQPAGFAVNFSLIEYSEQSSYGRALLTGLLNTLLVAVVGIVLATLTGFSAGIARLSRNWLVARLAGVYVESLRNIPLLLQLFFWYFAVLRALPSPAESLYLLGSVPLNNRGLYLPAFHWEEGDTLMFLTLLASVLMALVWAFYRHGLQKKTGRRLPLWIPVLALMAGLPVLVFLLSGARVSFEVARLQGFNFVGGSVLIPELIALILALSVYTGTFIAENVRSGIQAVKKGQTEAACALGLSPGQTTRLIVLPQAMRIIIPPLTSQYLNLIKNSSLAVAIAYPDLVSVFAGTTLSQTGQAVEIITITMGIYLALSLLTSAFMNFYNARMMLKDG